MMPSPENVPNLWKYLDEFQKSMAEIHASLSNPREKAVLGELLEQLQEGRKEVERTVPDLVQELHRKNLDLKAWAEEFLPEIEKQQRELEARLQAAAEAQRAAAEAGLPATPEETTAPNLGSARGAELLQRFGRKTEVAPGGFVDEGSVASAWVEPGEGDAARLDETASQPASGIRKRPATTKATPPVPPKAPKKDKEPHDDIWEGLSRLDE